MVRARAFTLLEMLVAIALGMVIIGTIYSGFRAAAQAMTATERLAIENRLLVAGMAMAIDEADSWELLDRPGHQPLRTSAPYKAIYPFNGGYAGDASDWQTLPQPFTALAGSWPVSGASAAFDPSWPAHDPRTWYRGDGGHYFPHNQNGMIDESAFGDYGIFANAAGAVALRGTSVPVGSTWLPNQLKGLMYGLGFYGFFDYLPANAMVDYYDVDGAARSAKPYTLRFLDRTPNQTTTWDMFNSGRFTFQGTDMWGIDQFCTSAERASTRGWYLYSNQVGIAAAHPQEPGETPANYAERQRRAAAINRTMHAALRFAPEKVNTFPILYGSLNDERPLLAQKPVSWPRASVDVRRYLKWGNVVNGCHVRLVDPVTGMAQEIAFTTVGTTLRGARMNRNLD
ncbi:MAG: prepilin-type N-terminal cleavage/methylation domain-containing protein [Planctomycetes bacterium]|nr:prepilin-type N-terminal cleavage/methylation domain-containing protein [Planctomycetota bacterium]